MVKNLVLAIRIPKEKFGASRIVNLPGITVNVEGMLETLWMVGGEGAVRLVDERRDEAIEKIVDSWATRFDVARAESLGFADDGPLIDTVRAYIEDYGDCQT